MKSLQKFSISVFTIIGKGNNTQKSQSMKEFLLPTFMDSINSTFAIVTMVIIGSLPRNNVN